ncbi:MAG: PAS domain-containing protein [Proteobacteria bacterium]|nr:PAS domain-containing protein [Pseudomonadota bacterium]
MRSIPIPLEQVLINLPDGITIQDREFNIIFQNNAMEKAFGNHLGEKCYAVYERRDRICERCGVQKAFETGKPNMVIRTATLEDGTSLYLENSCFPLFDHQGNIVAGVEVCRDITDRVSLESAVKERNVELGQINRQLNQQTAQLEAALAKSKKTERQLQESTAAQTAINTDLQRAYDELHEAQSRILQQEKMASVGQLAAGVAHEINNPIGFIISNLNTLKKYTARLIDFQHNQDEALGKFAGLAPETGRYILTELDHKRKSLKIDLMTDDIEPLIQESLEGGDHVKRIVQNLKSFARVDDQEDKMANINEGLESTLNIIWNELKYKATITKVYGDIPLILCNPGQLNQVFMNLLVNAAQAIEKHGKINLETRREGESVLVVISDTGGGIPQQTQGRIFEPFFTTKEVGKGTGLGLSICYDIVKKHGGEIQVESRVGQGSRFTIRLPIRSETE